jgi:DNA-binding response OmpR family regulator
MDPESPDNRLRVFIALNRDSIERTLEAVDAGVHELLLKPFSDLKLFAAMRTCYREPRRFLHLDGYVGPDRRRGMTMGRCRFRRKEDSAIGEPALQAV